jgi:broad specificity phosphatase PhoE
MKIFFARHGESPANILHKISNRGLKHPLTSKGREQAHRLAERLQDHSISCIYSGPILRAIETTVIIANQLGVDYEVTEALREYDLGDLEARSDERTWELWQQLFDDWMQHRHWPRRAPGGESFCDVKNRFVPFINRLLQDYRGTQTNLLCIGHDGLYWVILPLVLTNIDTEFILNHESFPHASLIISELWPEVLVCLEWNGFQVTT